jgi:cyclopropane fatty-acyl-phospholipid synthase-like methyltransferase
MIFLNSEDYYDNISEVFKKYHTYQMYLFDDLENTHKLLSNFISNKHSRILDLGCGIGTFINYLNHNGFKNTTGVVNSQKLFEISQKYQANIIKDDMNDFMSKHKKSFDIIFNIESVGYVNIDTYFDKAYECLDDNGIIVLKDFTALGDPKDTGKYYGNYHFHNHETIIQTAEKYGFENLCFKYIDHENTNQTYYMNSLKEFNIEYVDSSQFNDINVISFAVYIFCKNPK